MQNNYDILSFEIKIKFMSFKKILTILAALLFLFVQNVEAQRNIPKNLPTYDDKPYHFGFILGYNQMLYSINYVDNYQNIEHHPVEWPDCPSQSVTIYTYNAEPLSSHGFTVGIVGNLRLAKYFDLRLVPSLSFGERKMLYSLHTTNDLGNGEIEHKNYDITKSIHSTFVEIPLQVKYKSKRLNNVAAYLITGLNYKIDLASQKKNQIEVFNPITQEYTTKIDNIRVKRTDLAAEIGAGFDFYTGYFKMGIEVKMGYGLFNILDKENVIYSSSFDKLHNKTFQLSLTFE